MGNIFKKTTAARIPNNDNGPLNPPQIQFPSCMGTEPIISIPIDANMDQSIDKRIRLRARHAASDFPATFEAHTDHKIAILKQYLIKSMGFPSQLGDVRCKILMVWQKRDLLQDEPLETDKENKLEMNQRYLGGSIDHLTLSEYGLENGDFIMFAVTFPKINR